jgi:hypothetical protein
VEVDNIKQGVTPCKTLSPFPQFRSKNKHKATTGKTSAVSKVIRNQQVGGSTPPAGFISFGERPFPFFLPF